MRYVPTVTGIWKSLNLEGVEEVLLTPKSLDLPKEPSTILIDNGCWRINNRGASSGALEDHITLCELIEDPRCIFILPDVKDNKEVGCYFLNKFLERVKPKRFSLVDLEFFLDRKDLLEASEFLSIPSKRARRGKHHFDISIYHQLGSCPIEGSRSWDEFDYDPTQPIKNFVAAYSR